MFTPEHIRNLLDRVASRELDVSEALDTLRAMPFEQTPYATIDHHRQLRDGFGEVVYCQSKSAEQVAQIVAKLADHGGRVLATRATDEQFQAACALVPDLHYDELARAIWLDRNPRSATEAYPGTVVVAAGTSDLPVAAEATLTLKLLGHKPQCITDVGVAGLHRLLHHVETLQTANVIVAIAGMEGALPSVIGGITSAPVVAVPTSVGYGTSFGGITALLAMLNTCASGVTVVNIDNGFGAGYFAGTVNRKIVEAGRC